MLKIFKIICLTLIAAAISFGFKTLTRQDSPEATAMYNKNGLDIKVKYCRPSKKDRQIFGKLVPYGEVWRTGANKATSITFNKNVSVAGKSLKAGTYGLFTIPGEKEWTIIFNSVSDQWGAFKYDKGKDVLRVTVSPAPLETMKEKFEISFEEQKGGAVHMLLDWDKTCVTVPIK